MINLFIKIGEVLAFMSIHERIHKLSEIFRPYQIYPMSRFHSGTAAKIMQNKYEGSHYIEDLNTFLNNQVENSNRIGADLPWWGKKYFTNEKGVRIFIISQDSLAIDAGSIVFYMPFMDDLEMNNKLVEDFINSNGLDKFAGWGITKEFFKGCGINLDYVYVTDARKVYPENSFNDGTKAFLDELKNYKNELKAYDIQRTILESNSTETKQLLIEEINYCKPDIIITLGEVGFRYLFKEGSLKAKLSMPNTITPILDTRIKVLNEFVAAPFPVKVNPRDYSKGLFFEPYLSNVKDTVRKKISELYTSLEKL
jgi:hypothetical protein